MGIGKWLLVGVAGLSFLLSPIPFLFDFDADETLFWMLVCAVLFGWSSWLFWVIQTLAIQPELSGSHFSSLTPFAKAWAVLVLAGYLIGVLIATGFLATLLVLTSAR
jgi:hypothetical protein